ncbi:hypothetical protein PPGU19_028380 [Paraburkholderia sp. PGU19]|uniref:hypothetical protein n=1 Tax=Paraburkholderia sp. PGU19 TaxID=2735434 RepID=UPI0015DAF02C|nr:hypothetical protein [Paraburkholderia sp. PGU19]BCF98269.1 hypothetical protein PPGU19_028380 [Paraburkholderia sp. PGU19]
MAAHLRSRQCPARVHPLRVGLRSRVLLLAAALASALVLMPHAHAQDNPAQGKGQNAAAPKGNGNANANANGAPARKTASQRTQEDAQRLLGGPTTSLGGYDPGGTTPDSQRDALLNSERMRVAKPNTQAMGGPSVAGGGASAGGAIRRPARGAAAGGGAADNGGVAGGAAQRGGAVNAANAGGATVYSSPYSERSGREVFKSPW